MSQKKIISQSALVEASGKTAIYRPKPSRPARKVLDSYLTLLPSVLDWGCGRGKDVLAYRAAGLSAIGYDLNHQKILPYKKYDLITCTYVLNTLPLNLRQKCLEDALKHLKLYGLMLVAVRSAKDVQKESKRSRLWMKHLDGYVTSRGTFQHGFEQDELDELVQSVGMTLLPAPFKISDAVVSLSHDKIEE